MLPHEYIEKGFDFVVLTVIGFFGFLASNVSTTLGIIYGTLSISYLLWKWRKEYLKAKKEEQVG